ncbi:AraC family transcriptional regulator [Flavobacterium aquidurense]|uniref:Response regulator receiver protein n=1 Tax=Flavobacterium aquidurense TaxID=362413 RepID=A0A0N8VMN7_9FLAO|nr:AraC family transcriptional regulator [Flavobacterium aquidurense]KQB39836.1 Response regulator receiver protein [Flavobacterium aquidurense]
MAISYPILSLLSITQFVISQQKTYTISDSLKSKNYEYLDERIDIFKRDPSKAEPYVVYYLLKAKSEKNSLEIVNGYKNYLLLQSDDKSKLIYTDSMVYAARKSQNNALIGSAYLSKGIVYYSQKKYADALDNYIIANDFISKTKDEYLIYKVKYNMALIKYYLGLYDESLALFKDCVNHFKNTNDRAYLNSLHSLGLTYNKLGNYGLCSETNKIGLLAGRQLNNREMECYFMHSEGINQYSKQNYALSIKIIKSTLSCIRANKDFANETLGDLYIGKSYWALNRKQQALHYFDKADRMLDERQYVRPELQEMYELLIDYYITKKKSEVGLYYINRLLKADSISNATYKYLYGKVVKDYDTKKLRTEKKKIEIALNRKKYRELIFIIIINLLVCTSCYLVYRNLRNRRNYRKKFAELMSKNEKVKDSAKLKKIPMEELDVNPDAVIILLKQLEKFERDKKFLEMDWTLVKLAASFNSNTKYLSKVIYFHRGKKFADYINDLKIDYLIELMKTNRMLRNYTNKALAEEAGFSTTQRFTNAFYSRVEISPTFFIRELERQQL